ncbi:hypothetical protein LTR56_002886 [Elasticomyces elasticus]|nr:hypothetical protein LTR56_002886 [Elasticomyces elasticus]KAK3665152.1 hypothetical protein LTR22_003959 [Elasticomyces elasticus]KAK4930673.1 hypothetical protein LTR49_002760 [Elasticomyces elasticus]KAK5759896.1 hypothetical protein LTS12_009943 [Elasticomyces elasticus]
MADPKDADITAPTDAHPATLMTLPDELLLQILTDSIPQELTPSFGLPNDPIPLRHNFKISTMLVNKHIRSLAIAAWTANYTHDVRMVHIPHYVMYNRRHAIRHTNIRKLCLSVFCYKMDDSGAHPAVRDMAKYLDSFPQLREVCMAFDIYWTGSFDLAATRDGIVEVVRAWTKQEHGLGITRRALLGFVGGMRGLRGFASEGGSGGGHL